MTTTPRQCRNSAAAPASDAAPEAQLWRMADALRGSMDAAEYKHVVLGLVFLKYISDAFEERRAELDPEEQEEPDAYRGWNVFWVPSEARWPNLQALRAAAHHRASRRRGYDRRRAGKRSAEGRAAEGLCPGRAGQGATRPRGGHGQQHSGGRRRGSCHRRAGPRVRVLPGAVRYCRGPQGRRVLHPAVSVVRMLVEMLEPYHGRVYDPCCGSSGMFVQSVEFIRAHASGNGNGGRAKRDISIYGQESNYTTWRLAKMNLALRGIEGQIAQGDSFHNDQHPDLRADFILANPPFNVSDWGGDRLRSDRRWEFGVPPDRERQLRVGAALPAPPVAAGHCGVRAGQRLHVVEPIGRGRDSAQGHHRGGFGGLHHRPAGSTFPFYSDPRVPMVPVQRSAQRRGPRTARRNTVHRRAEAGATWWTGRAATTLPRTSRTSPRHTTPGETGALHRPTPTPRVSAGARRWTRCAGTATSSPPGRYVGAAPQEDDGEPFAQKMARLAAQWREQQAEASRLDAAIAENLAKLGFGGVMEVGEKADLNRWREVTLGDLIDIKHGYAFKGEFIHDEPVGDVLITPGNFAIGGGFQSGKTKYYSGTVPEDFVLAENDLLVTMTDLSKQADTLGYSALVPASQDGRRFLHNQRLGKIALRKTESADTRFLYYVLCSREYRNEVLASATGTTVKHTSPERIKRYRFPLPCLPEQRAIAHVLGTLDDKIELNRRMCETLEAMARALFQSWFVDFEPVRAKMEGRWRPGESLPGLPAEHYHLFPDTLVPSALGDIPKGWQVRTLGEVVEIYDNLRIPLNSRQRSERQGPYPYYGAAGIMDYVDGYLFDGEYVLTGEDGSVVDEEGYPVVQHVWGQFWVNNHAHVLRSRMGVGLAQLYLFLKRTNIAAYVTGAVQPKLSQTNLCAVPFLLPSKGVCEAFADLADSLFKQVRYTADESNALAEQRDVLLPKVISGEVRV